MQMSTSTASPSEVTLISEDGIKFQVRIQVVRCIGLFKNLLELNSSINFGSNGIPPLQVPNVNSLILDKIIEYLNNYTASRENSALTKPIDKVSPVGMKVKSIISGIQNKSAINDDDDDDEIGGDDEIEIMGSIQDLEQGEQDLNDFEVPSDDENVFDFANFDEQSLKLFTPYEQNFFGSLDIPTLIEITKVIENGLIFKISTYILYLFFRLPILCIFLTYWTVVVKPLQIT